MIAKEQFHLWKYMYLSAYFEILQDVGVYCRMKGSLVWYEWTILIIMSIQINIQFSSVQFSCSVVSDSLWPHGLQYARPPCPSPTPGVYSNSCPLSPVMPSKHLILCHPLLLLPSIFLSIRVFSYPKCALKKPNKQKFWLVGRKVKEVTGYFKVHR